MIPNDQPARKEMIERMLDYCSKEIAFEDGRYTEWESNFIVSIEEQFSEKEDLSQKQCEILERIYDK